MPPPDTREILENPPENRPGTVRGDSEPLRIAPDCYGAILKHNLSQGRTTMEGRTTMPKPIIFVTPAQSAGFGFFITGYRCAISYIGPKSKPFVATQGRQTIIKTTTNLLSFDWMGLEAGQQCALLALLSLI